MNCWTRRQFGCLAGAACLTAVAPRVARSQTKARVVVIGGGIGGATVAKYLAASAAGIEVTLVEPKPRYTTCFFSALYLAGMRSFKSLTHGYEALAQRYGIKIASTNRRAHWPDPRGAGTWRELPFLRLFPFHALSCRDNVAGDGCGMGRSDKGESR